MNQKYLVDIKKEIFRKLIHLCSFFTIILLNSFYSFTLKLLLFASILYLCSEIFRLNQIYIPVITLITNVAARKCDENRIVLGPITLCIGIFLTAFFFPSRNCYSIGILSLAFGDGLASVSGKFFGKNFLILNSKKTVEGSLTCFLGILVSCFIFTKNAQISLMVAFLGMFIEMLPIKDFDNILIPFCTALFVSQYK